MATEKRLIQKLPTGSTSKDGIWWERHPTREDVIEKIDEIVEVLNTLLEEPIAGDAVKVVRCKDCRFYNKDTVSCSFVTADANWYEDDFCSYGERRTDG